MEKTQNVIVVILDSLRADRVGALGSDRSLTPNIDSLAKNGITFEKAYTCINATDPSITSIHTGRYPRSTIYHHGQLVTDKEKKRAKAATRLPELLSKADIKTYATGYTLGRWNREGFTKYEGMGDSREQFLQTIQKKLQSIDERLYKIASRSYQKLTQIEQRVRSPDKQQDDGITNILEIISDTHSPFYGLVHLMDTHIMYEADEQRIEKCLRRFDYPNQDLERFFSQHSNSIFLTDYVKERVTERDYDIGMARLLARYDASVASVDEKIRTLIEGLKQQNKWNETALFVMADHGESLTEHGIYFDHHGLYDESIHIPLVAKIPGFESQKCSEFVQPIDLFPTILSLFGISSEVDHDGYDLLPFLRGETDTWRDAVFVEEAYTQRRTAVRTDEWKYITHRPDETLDRKWGGSLECGYCKALHGGPEELYHLLSDPEETENCIDEYPSVVNNMREQIESFEDKITYPQTDEEEQTEFGDEDEVIQRLENLGYQ